mgnify:CR=1 FL=1
MAVGAITHGLDARILTFARHATAVIQMYDATNGTRTSLGMNSTALAEEAELAYLTNAVRTQFSLDLEKSILNYHEEFDSMTSSTNTLSLLTALATVTVVCLLYIFVLRELVQTMMNTARRTENMLLALPEAMAKSNSTLMKFFTRKGAVGQR